jgi:hypothetical protein
MKHKHPRRRALLATLGLAAFAAPALASGCGGGFAPISEIDGLRVLAVVADKPYAKPGDQVQLTIKLDDGYADPTTPDGGARPPTNVWWIPGCFDPPGDDYYGCYAQFAAELGKFDGGTPPTGLIPTGDSFTFTLPSDIITRRPPPASGQTPYGVAFVFFLACSGSEIRVVQDEGGRAGSFPIGCFDADNNRLGADSFVPGYTEVFAFADGRTNANPLPTGLSVTNLATDAGVAEDAGPAEDAAIPACSLPEASRNAAGCGAVDPFKTCTDYRISVQVPNDVAELDPSTKDSNGNPLHEAVWVDYFADRGDIQDPVLLVSDATLGIQSDYSTIWIPPPTSGVANLWAVVHDSRGGAAVVEQHVLVQ